MPRTPETFRPDPAETFEAEFMNTALISAQEFMQKFGLRSEGSHDDSKGIITHSGSRPDGTKVEIKFIKGANYKSPAQIEQEYKASIDKEKK